MRRHHRTYNYKFTERRHSAKGIGGLILAILSLALGCVMIILSALNQGAGDVYLGSGGVLSMLLAFTAFVMAVSSFKEEKSYKVFPILATFFSILTLGGEIALYVLGFLM